VTRSVYAILGAGQIDAAESSKSGYYARANVGAVGRTGRHAIQITALDARPAMGLCSSAAAREKQVFSSPAESLPLRVAIAEGLGGVAEAALHVRHALGSHRSGTQRSRHTLKLRTRRLKSAMLLSDANNRRKRLG